jgi:transposase
VIAPAPEPSIPGTMCGPRLMATILTDKYADHLPHYRQAGRFLRRHGVELSRQKLNLWTHAAAAHLAPVNAAILAELRGASVLQIDETPGDYLAPGTGKVGQGYFWLYRDAVAGTLYCDWRLGRGHDCLLEILGLDEETGVARFSGAIQCDGFIAYQTLVSRYAGIRLAGCLTHVRRKFYDARKQSPEAALPILQLIARIYRVEEWVRETKAPPDCRLLVRRGHAVPHLVELKEALLAARAKHYPSSLMGEAVGYALNRWEEIERCFEDGRLEIDNNLVENAIRPVKLGLKNYLFFGNAEAGKTSALFYTLLGNCKALGIDYERYLEVVLDRVTSKTTPEEAAQLTPAKLAEEIRARQPVPSGAAAVTRAA